MKKWVSLEKRIKEIEVQSGYWSTAQGKRKPVSVLRDILPQTICEEYSTLRMFRNNLVHGQYVPTSAELEHYKYRTDAILKALENWNVQR